MTQEEKELLLKDISARFQYGVKCQSDIHSSIVAYCKLEAIKRDIHGGFYFELTDRDAEGTALASTSTNDIGMVKPYLRPMSSMTVEEKFEYNGFDGHIFSDEDVIIKIDWLNAHHFDYRGLIEKGLALEEPEEMYNTKTTCNNCEDKSYCSQSEYVKNNCYKLK